MAKQYEYKARDSQGQLFSGSVLADSEAAAAYFVRNKGYYVTLLKEAKPKQDVRVMFQSLRTVSIKDISLFCRQFATMLEAGLPMLTCLNILAEQTENTRLKEVIQIIFKSVQEGNSLSSSLRQYSDIFPDLMISMVEAGELGGVMDTIMNRLAIQFEKQHRLNEKVKSAMTYPVVVISFAILVSGFILTFILPTFVAMFATMKVELPLITQILLGLSHFVSKYWWAILLTLVSSAIGMKRFFQQPQYREWLDGVRLKVPIFGTLWQKIAIARFSRTLSTLIRGGVPIISALDVVKRSTGNMKMVNALSASQESIKEGQDLSSRLGASKLFPPLVVQMVAVGEEAGELDKMLDKVADFYDDEVEDMVSRLSGLLEPVLILILGLIVGTVVISILLPMFDVMTQMNKV